MKLEMLELVSTCGLETAEEVVCCSANTAHQMTSPLGAFASVDAGAAYAGGTVRACIAMSFHFGGLGNGRNAHAQDRGIAMSFASTRLVPCAVLTGWQTQVVSIRGWRHFGVCLVGLTGLVCSCAGSSEESPDDRAAGGTSASSAGGTAGVAIAAVGGTSAELVGGTAGTMVTAGASAEGGDGLGGATVCTDPAPVRPEPPCAVGWYEYDDTMACLDPETQQPIANCHRSTYADGLCYLPCEQDSDCPDPCFPVCGVIVLFRGGDHFTGYGVCKRVRD